MPGVVSLRETSETQHRPSYFRGQCWGALGLVVGSLAACFCLPLELRIHQGFRHLGQDPSASQLPRLSLAERVVQMALSFATGYDCPALLSPSGKRAFQPEYGCGGDGLGVTKDGKRVINRPPNRSCEREYR